MNVKDIMHEVFSTEVIPSNQSLLNCSNYFTFTSARDLLDGCIGKNVTYNVLKDLHIIEKKLWQIFVQDRLHHDKLINEFFTLNDFLRVTAKFLSYEFKIKTLGLSLKLKRQIRALQIFSAAHLLIL